MTQNIRKHILLSKQDLKQIEANMRKEGFKHFSAYARQKMLTQDSNTTLTAEHFDRRMDRLETILNITPEELKEMRDIRDFLVNDIVPKYNGVIRNEYNWSDLSARNRLYAFLEDLKRKYHS